MTTVRRAGAASVAALSGLALALGFSHALAPGWAKGVGLDVWNLAEEREAAHKADADATTLQLQHEQLLREIELADHVATRLAEGKQTLADAVAELEPILRQRAGFASQCELKYHTPSFRHGVARYVINRVTLAPADPARRAAVARNLEAEYAALQ
jgi:hypothetical protein